MGLKGRLLDAGFADPVASASFNFYGTPKEATFFYSVAVGPDSADARLEGTLT